MSRTPIPKSKVMEYAAAKARILKRGGARVGEKVVQSCNEWLERRRFGVKYHQMQKYLKLYGLS